MAPDVALRAIHRLPKGALVLDPMVGSGTVLRAAIDSGHPAIGFDVDPLSVLMSEVWVTPIDTEEVRKAARKIASQSEKIAPYKVLLPWIDKDSETLQFIHFWFDTPQIEGLRRISWLLAKRNDVVGNALRIAVSRLIIQKKRGASLAGDVSHSRPHRIRRTNDFNVISEFVRSADKVANQLEKDRTTSDAIVEIGDARNMQKLPDNAVDAIVSSPPYLNAIDYLRGHRLSLVWFGYSISELRQIRAESVGVARAPDAQTNLNIMHNIVASCGDIDLLPCNKRAMIFRFASDVDSFLGEANRVLQPGGIAVYVVGNSSMNGIFIDNTSILINAANLYGWRLVDRYEREILANRRYMPPPNKSNSSPMRQRMGTECIVTFHKPMQRQTRIKKRLL